MSFAKFSTLNNRRMNIKIKKLRNDALLPVKKTEDAIGYDLAVPCDICIERKRQVIPLGFALELPKGVEAKVEPRSGFSSKGIEGFELIKPGSPSPSKLQRDEEDYDGPLFSRVDMADYFNADVIVGKIDPDYRGECGVIILNHEPGKPFLIKAGTRIAQMTFYNVASVDHFEVVEELSETKRGTGGFGHTGA
jgi:dUTP pyrophosphatase